MIFKGEIWKLPAVGWFNDIAIFFLFFLFLFFFFHISTTSLVIWFRSDRNQEQSYSRNKRARQIDRIPVWLTRFSFSQKRRHVCFKEAATAERPRGRRARKRLALSSPLLSAYHRPCSLVSFRGVKEPLERGDCTVLFSCSTGEPPPGGVDRKGREKTGKKRRNGRWKWPEEEESLSSSFVRFSLADQITQLNRVPFDFAERPPRTGKTTASGKRERGRERERERKSTKLDAHTRRRYTHIHIHIHTYKHTLIGRRVHTRTKRRANRRAPPPPPLDTLNTVDNTRPRCAFTFFGWTLSPFSKT